jgi:hypothetical protein
MEDGSEVDVLPSGAVIIYEVSKPKPTYENDEFGVNLADRMTPELRSRLSEELIEGVEADIETRKDLVAQFKDGIELLGTRLEQVTSPSTATRSVSRVGHPLLIETMIKYQAGAEAELLPAEGPAKVMTIGRVSDAEEQLAQDFEDDFNYFLTDVAEEFYDDTAGMLMHQAYCGNAYKKVYRDPMRERPVSESVSMLQLIVSEDAAKRTAGHARVRDDPGRPAPHADRRALPGYRSWVFPGLRRKQRRDQDCGGDPAEHAAAQGRALQALGDRCRN